jgi:hypothetical protein
MSDYDDEHQNQSYWPSVTDLFLTLFIIAIAIVAVVFCALLPTNNVGKDQALVNAVGNDLRHIRDPMNRLRVEIGLDQVDDRDPSIVIKILNETCDVAIRVLKELKKNDPEGMAQKIQVMNLKIKELEELANQLRDQLKKNGSRPDFDELKRRIAELERENEDLKRDSRTRVIAEQRKEFQFDPGSALIKKDFSNALREKVTKEQGGFYEPPFPEIAAEVIKLQERINTLEIIGHTDGVPLSRYGNLDQMMPILLTSDLQGLERLSAGSNNDLGLLRSLALKREWINYVDSYEPNKDREILRRLKIRCYSAGQTIPPVPFDNPTIDVFRKKDDRARRIEMRLTRHADDSSE